MFGFMDTFVLKDTAVICAIAKNEELYIEEWIQYHLYLGFDHIYIYDNAEGNPLQDIPLWYMDKVTIVPYLGRCQQMNAYYHFKYTYRIKHTWVAYIDVDEFIVLKRHESIHELLRTHCSHGALALNWVLFGSNGKEIYEPFPVLQRFTKRQAGVNEHVKWIVCMNDLSHMVSPHHGVLHYGNARDCHENIVRGPYNPNGSDAIACIHHYFTKSRQEFMYKCSRGRADIPEFRTVDGDFQRHDLNDIEDTSAWEFFCRKSEIHRKN